LAIVLGAAGASLRAQAQESESPSSDAADSLGTDVNAEAEPLTTGTGMLPTSVTVGVIDPNGKVPTVNAVAGAAVPNIDVSFPTSILTHGNSYCFTVSLQDVNVTGAYEVDYYIKRTTGGKTKTLLEQTLVSGNTAPGDVWVWDAYSKAIPDSPGTATLVGRVRWGTGFKTQAIITSTILIQ